MTCSLKNTVKIPILVIVCVIQEQQQTIQQEMSDSVCDMLTVVSFSTYHLYSYSTSMVTTNIVSVRK